MALDRTLQNLENAEKHADDAQAKLAEQNRRLEKMQNNMCLVHNNLDETEECVDDLAGQGMLGGLLKKGAKATKMDKVGDLVLSKADQISGIEISGVVKSAMGIASHKVIRIDPGGQPLMKTWMWERGTFLGYPWDRRWCVLHSTGMLIYDSESGTNAQNSFLIRSSTRCYSFKSALAPGDSLEHRGERPFGFVVVQEVAIKGRPKYHYFDPETEAAMKTWQKAIHKVATRRRIVEAGGVATFDKLSVGTSCTSRSKSLPQASTEEKHAMACVNEKLDSLANKARDIGEEARKQRDLVGSVQANVDTANHRIIDQDTRLKEHLREEQGEDSKIDIPVPSASAALLIAKSTPFI
eukprot:TRINITY_DN13034_c0_g1_i1.p1 TRINITY_DN13034_c0_g1~~TRINITY_DN13034_c0_g1_i1.p1  ORF type:complete len:369 (-),score=74.87 TRINITY_DN13034_c0_g1_i1:29-1087(-)